jgi:hypothetical protein
MQAMRQGSTGQVARGQGPVIWQSAETSAGASALEAAVQEVDLLPEFEELLRDSTLEDRHVPGREGLLG